MMRPAAWNDEAYAAMRLASSPFGPLACIEQMMHGADLFIYERAKQRAFVAVRPVALFGGQRLDIVGLSSVGDRLQGRAFHAAIDRLAIDHRASLLACCTSVTHVAQSCTKNGFSITGAVLTKNTGFTHG